MPKHDSKPKTEAQLTELFLQSLLPLDQAIHFAFLQYHHQPSVEDEARLKQRISLLLLDDDFRRLRSYNQQAKLETWLQVLVNREASHFLQQESRHVSPDDAPADLFIQPPMQGTLLLDKEQRYLLEKALPKLTPRQRKVFED